MIENTVAIIMACLIALSPFILLFVPLKKLLVATVAVLSIQLSSLYFSSCMAFMLQCRTLCNFLYPIFCNNSLDNHDWDWMGVLFVAAVGFSSLIFVILNRVIVILTRVLSQFIKNKIAKRKSNAETA
jgi:hypothetical protein